MRACYCLLVGGYRARGSSNGGREVVVRSHRTLRTISTRSVDGFLWRWL